MTSNETFDAAQAKVAKTLGEQIFEEKVKNVMYGGLDGVITTFAIVCAGIGMQLTDKEIFIIALASLFADAFSMGYGDFVSSNMQRNYYVQEYDKSKRCYRVNHDQEVARFTDLLLAKGLDYEDATRISSTYSLYEDVFVNEITRLELDMDDPGSLLDIGLGAMATFMSFVVVGGIPIIVFCLADMNKTLKSYRIPILSVVCGIMLFCLGSICAHYTKQSRVYSGIETTLYGITAAAVAYAIAHFAA